jgi:lipopolysaccharide/colanic/teichoic acid biosynthesis glycosyltransferase
MTAKAQDHAVPELLDTERLFETALVRRSRGNIYRKGGKRLLDVICVALMALPAIVLVLPFLALLSLDGHSPFYRQKRVGRDGRVFDMWKLRSMVPDADRMLEAHLAANPDARAEWEWSQKLRDDPRITPIGRFIRKSSIDELPQLWNVLTGDMSLVGPRPMTPEQRELYPGLAYYALRPGITGYWQTSVRNESSFAERALHDTGYFRDLSFGTDLKVLLRTVRVVLNATGR